MKSVVISQFGGPEVLEVKDVDLPKVSEGTVRVRVMSTGVNPVDTYFRSGFRTGFDVPFTPGSDAAGIVDAVGSGVDKVREGDRVWLKSSLSGTYAQYTLAKVEQVELLPENTTFEEGSGLWVPYGTAYHAIFHRSDLKDGETVLVHGASGGVGLACIQFPNARIIGTVGSQEAADFLAQYNIEVVNHKDEGYVDKIRAFGSIDVVFEMLANINLATDCQLISRGGRILVIGCRGEVTINPRMLMGRRADIRGVMFGQLQGNEHTEVVGGIIDGCVNGFIKPRIWDNLPLASAPEAHKLIIDPKGGSKGKLTLNPWK